MTNKTKASIDRAKYELHMRQKAAIEEAANEHKKRFNSLVRGLIEEDDHAYESFIKGAEHVIEHPEKYGLVSMDKYLTLLKQKEAVEQECIELNKDKLIKWDGRA